MKVTSVSIRFDSESHSVNCGNYVAYGRLGNLVEEFVMEITINFQFISLLKRNTVGAVCMAPDQVSR